MGTVPLLLGLTLLELVSSSKPISSPEVSDSSVTGLDPEKWCSELVDSLSSASGSYVTCLNRYARPVQICINCWSEFWNVTNAYEAIKKPQPMQVDGVNASCWDVLSGKDRLQVVPVLYETLLGSRGMWGQGYCESCYVNGSSSQGAVSNVTMNFMIKYFHAKECFEESSRNETLNPCQVCEKPYAELREFYNDNIYSISHHTDIENVCIDIQDKFNHTTQMWYDFGCLPDYDIPWTINLWIGAIYFTWLIVFVGPGFILPFFGIPTKVPYNIVVETGSYNILVRSALSRADSESRRARASSVSRPKGIASATLS